MLFFSHNLALKRRINFSGYILNIPYKCGDQTKSNGSARLTANIKPNQTRIYRLQYSWYNFLEIEKEKLRNWFQTYNFSRK